MRTGSTQRGFSLAEVIMAIGVVALIILGVALLALTIIRSRTESSDRVVSTPAAAQILDDLVAQAQTDPDFWNNDFSTTPYQQGSTKIGQLEYHYSLRGFTVRDSGGTPVGQGLPDNRLKLLELEVSWFDSQSSGGRQGYGELSTTLTKLVSQSEGEP